MLFGLLEAMGALGPDELRPVAGARPGLLHRRHLRGRARRRQRRLHRRRRQVRRDPAVPAPMLYMATQTTTVSVVLRIRVEARAGSR